MEVTREIRVPVEVTRIVVVTVTPSGPTGTPQPTIDRTKSDKTDGFYMVGLEIAPGVWRSSGGSPSEECWRLINNFDGDTEDITGELPGATIRVPNGEYIVLIGGGSGNRCTWSFPQP